MTPKQVTSQDTRFSRISILAAAVLAVITSLSFTTTTRELCHGFLPENDMKIPVGFKSMLAGTGGLSEAEFNSVIDRAIQIYGPIVAQQGGQLSVNRLWSDSTVNASAEQSGSTWILNMYGGLARHPSITIEGFALVVCHELGHHIGGAPKGKGFFGMRSWATNEGGADYFANLKCLRNFFAGDDNATILDEAKKAGRLSSFAASLCEQQFAKDSDRDLCKRSTLGGTSVAGLFKDLRKEANPPDFATPDTSKVSKMFDDHPKTQCRMDTYLAGAICDVDVTVAVSNRDYRQGSCVENVAKVGYRPRCWFAP